MAWGKGVGKRAKLGKEVDEANERPKVCNPTNFGARIVAKQASLNPSLFLFFSGRLGFAVVCRSDRVVSAEADGRTSPTGTTSVCQMFEQNVCRFLWTPPGPN